MAYLQRGLKDICKHWRQLVSTVIQGGWGNRVRSGCFPRILSLEDSVYISFLDGERHSYDGAEGGGGH